MRVRAWRPLCDWRNRTMQASVHRPLEEVLVPGAPCGNARQTPALRPDVRASGVSEIRRFRSASRGGGREAACERTRCRLRTAVGGSAPPGVEGEP